MKHGLPLLALLLATACTATTSTPPVAVAPAPAAPVAVDTAAEDARLNAFLDAAFDAQVALSPQTQTALGLKTNYDRLDDNTDAARQRSLALTQEQLRQMRAQFDPARLGPSARLSYRLFEEDVADSERSFQWRWHRFPATNFSSPLGGLPVFLINQHRVDSVSDAEAYISRLRDAERALGEVAANMRHQASLGIVPPAFNFAPVRADGRRILTGAPFTEGTDSAVFADFKRKVDRLQIAQAEKDRLVAAAREALTGPFRRGYESVFSALDAIEPRATGNQGAWSLPEGAAYYAERLRAQTTTDLTADQIHRIGLDNVARIHGEMRAIQQQVGFQGTLQQFFEHIRTSPEFKYPNTDEGRQQYLADARAFIAQVMEAAPRYFRRLPRAPLEVRAVEPFRQATAAVAFYNSPAPDGSRPGIYYVNLADMTQVLRPQVEAISYHEGAPGHHFQIALAQELPDVPKFRRFGGNGAYNEGWGLYAERLGKEMGFYQEPISDFGRLSTELWRAIRLVVDTGIHSQRWSREQAIDYFMQNGLLSRLDATKEVERYFNIPGQATSYMIGQLKIFELRDRARRELGDRFDIRDFHAAVLENGSVPLDVLEELVEAYIARARAS
ncbi:MAG: DUF885 domain-containing protein [Allosphingosinicella sp.]|uniref:DUF885 domain-containing protein n=1 Tax=Allosphingosinicella sp. TaxID=2823234 RepID=UPI00393FCDF3